MKNLLFYLAGAISTIFIVSLFNNTPKSQFKGSKDYDLIKYVVDTQYYPKVIKRDVNGDSIKIDSIVYINGFIEQDTAKAIKEYNAKVIYKDTLRIDSLSYVAILDTISRNRIAFRSYCAKFSTMIVSKESTFKEKPKLRIYGGFGIGIDKANLINNVNTSLLFVGRVNRAYSIGIGMDSKGNGFVNGSVYFKLR
jgi:hypothetical protein